MNDIDIDNVVNMLDSMTMDEISRIKVTTSEEVERGSIVNSVEPFLNPKDVPWGSQRKS